MTGLEKYPLVWNAVLNSGLWLGCLVVIHLQVLHSPKLKLAHIHTMWYTMYCRNVVTVCETRKKVNIAMVCRHLKCQCFIRATGLHPSIGTFINSLLSVSPSPIHSFPVLSTILLSTLSSIYPSIIYIFIYQSLHCFEPSTVFLSIRQSIIYEFLP